MSSANSDAVWRGKVISTLETLNHNDNVLLKNCRDIESKVNKHCIDNESRISTLENEIKNIHKQRDFQNKIIIGLILVVIGSILTMLINMLG